MRAILTLACLVASTLVSAAQTPATPAPSTQKPGMKPRPPLLYSEPWRLPPHTGEQTDENMRFTPAVVTNPRLEAKLYGPDAKVVRAAVHEERFDLWNGMASSPVAITLRDRRNYVDLTDPARLRWILQDQRDSSAAPGGEAGGRKAHRRRSRDHARTASSSPWRLPSPTCAGTRWIPSKSSSGRRCGPPT